MAAGYRGQFGFWLGGFNGAAVPPTLQAGGWQALPGFWVGGFHGDTGVVTVPPTVPPVGGGEPGRGAKDGHRRKRIDWIEPDVDIETLEPRPPPTARIKLNRGERKLVQLQAKARSQDPAVADAARARLAALGAAPDGPLARLIARQQALDDIRRARAAATADDDEAVMAFMRWLMSQ